MPPELYIVFALIVLVVLHELGHFLAAKAVGIRATKFYVFFPPAIFKRKVNDVEYGVGAIPLGGFVKLPGMFEPVPAEVAERLRWEFEDLEPLVRRGELQLRLDAARRAIANAPSPDAIIEPLTDVLAVLDGVEARSFADDGVRREATWIDGRLVAADDGEPLGDLERERMFAFAAAIPDAAHRTEFLDAIAATRDDLAPDDLADASAPAHRIVTDLVADDATWQAHADVVKRVRERVQNLLDDAHPKAYWRAALWRRMTVIFAGPAVNLLIAFIVLTGFIWLYSPRYDIVGPLVVSDVDKGSPAAEAGFDTGSKITSWNGNVIGLERDELGERIIESRGKPVEFEWTTADGEERTARVVPERLGDEDDKRLGVGLRLPDASVEVDHEVTSLGNGVQLAWLNIERITVDSLTRLPRVLFDAEVREDVGSVVGIVDFADEVDAAGLIVHYVAVISLILAVMNLLPLLPLDGGHLLFGLLEAIRRGRPMPRAAFERYSLIGMALVLMLFMIGLDNDIDRIRG